MPEQYDWKHRWYFGWQLARSLKMADAIVADSHNTKKDIIHFYGSRRSESTSFTSGWRIIFPRRRKGPPNG